MDAACAALRTPGRRRRSLARRACADGLRGPPGVGELLPGVGVHDASRRLRDLARRASPALVGARRAATRPRDGRRWGGLVDHDAAVSRDGQHMEPSPKLRDKAYLALFKRNVFRPARGAPALENIRWHRARHRFGNKRS